MNTRVYVVPLLLLAASLQADEKAKPTLAKAPFNGNGAKNHQEQWAEYLGQPVELTNSIGMKLVLIPPGEFLMGSPETERFRGSKENQHQVRITKPLYLGVYEVTQAEYQQVMRTTTNARRWTIPVAPNRLPTGCTGAAPITTPPWSAGRRAATGARRPSDSTPWASAWSQNSLGGPATKVTQPRVAVPTSRNQM